MKANIFCVSVLTALLVSSLVSTTHGQSLTSNAVATGAPTNAAGRAIASVSPPPLKLRKQMSGDARMQALEAAGIVPQDAESTDWDIAQRTRWWGKSIDSMRFWSNRAIWLSDDAVLEAHRYGRGYPPIPADASPAWQKVSHSKHIPVFNGFESGDRIDFQRSNVERVYWEWFSQNNPRPPQDIAIEQLQTAEREVHGDPNGTPPSVGRELKAGYPPEAFSEKALFWAYVLNHREQFKPFSDKTNPSNSRAAKTLLGGLKVDKKYICDPLTDQQMQEAYSWRIEYLNRLQKQSSNAVYISAYLKAWSIPTNSLSLQSK